MEILADMFQLDLPTVHSIISKMIINEELMVGRCGAAVGQRGAMWGGSGVIRGRCGAVWGDLG